MHTMCLSMHGPRTEMQIPLYHEPSLDRCDVLKEESEGKILKARTVPMLTSCISLLRYVISVFSSRVAKPVRSQREVLWRCLGE